MGYGAYGNYGHYNTYAGGYYMPYYMPNYGFPFTQVAEVDTRAKEKEAVEEKFSEIQSTFGKIEQRVAGLERLLTNMEPYLKAQESIQEERYKALDLKLEERIRALEKLQAVSSLESQVTLGLAKLEERLLNMEGKLRATENVPDALLSKLNGIDDRLVRLETNSLTVPSNNDQVKAMVSGMEEKLSLGMTVLEERLKQMETRLQNGSSTAATSNSDTLRQQQELIDQHLKNNFEKLQVSLTRPAAKSAQDEANRRVNRAVVIITLPADAKLFINGMESTVGSNLRTFVTPELEGSKNYYYTIRVELIRNGQLVTDSQRVYFQRGEEVRVSFDHLDAGIANQTQKNG
jgi:uncharacterized protein (TIGR03000 family)